MRQDCTAVTAIEAMVYVLRVHGCPRAVRFDRDPRFVGSWSAGEFPSAFMRLLMCLDIGLQICPPQRPDKNPFVERFNRNYKYECLLRDLPETVPQAQAVTLVYQNHYNGERPNQAVMLRLRSAQALQQPAATGSLSRFAHAAACTRTG